MIYTEIGGQKYDVLVRFQILLDLCGKVLAVSKLQR